MLKKKLVSLFNVKDFFNKRSKYLRLFIFPIITYIALCMFSFYSNSFTNSVNTANSIKSEITDFGSLTDEDYLSYGLRLDSSFMSTVFEKGLGLNKNHTAKKVYNSYVSKLAKDVLKEDSSVKAVYLKYFIIGSVLFSVLLINMFAVIVYFGLSLCNIVDCYISSYRWSLENN